MTSENYTVKFVFELDGSSLSIPLVADVAVHHSEIFYVISNIRSANHPMRSVLPDVRIKKTNGKWVHCDSEKETDLSNSIGEAIEDRDVGKRGTIRTNP